MKKTNRIKAAHIITITCLLLAGAMFYYIFYHIAGNIKMSNKGGKATRFEFYIDKSEDSGFYRDVAVYTEDGITKVSFSGKLTVEGTAEITVTSDKDNKVVYHQTYTDINAKNIIFEVDNLNPYSYYTLSFSSSDAKGGHLLLKTNKSLLQRPKRPKRMEPKSHLKK